MPTIVKGAPRVDETLTESTVLWRYIDLVRLIDLLRTGTLYFVRGDQLEDKFEWSFTKTIKEVISQSYTKNKIDFTYEAFRGQLRKCVFVNCWHASRDD